MNCAICSGKQCRKGGDCSIHSLDKEEILTRYKDPETQALVQAAAALVDGGRAGRLSRVEELLEFSKAAGYGVIGLAYCYSMEREATSAAKLFESRGFTVKAVSCTVTGLAQDQLNTASILPGVSCNPIAQAEEINREGVDLTVMLGLCMGHDILFHKYLKTPLTVLAVKDRVYGHCPLKALETA